MRIVVVGPIAGSLTSFRGAMLREMVAAGHEVLAVAPEDDDATRRALAADGVRFTTIPLSRAGLNPAEDARTVVALTRVFRAWRAETVLVYAPKPVVWGLLAARLARVRLRSAMITGVGSALGGGESLGRRALSRLLRLLYRVALSQAQVVFFQNDDDEALFRSLHLVGSRQRIVRINGSGVDLEHFAQVPMPLPPVTFLMISRLIADKGVREYVAAARQSSRAQSGARYRLLGPLDPNPTAISQAELDGWIAEGIINYLGSSDDVRPAISTAHVVVLPSYREGMPRSILEAMAMGRAVITTDAPGCRDTVLPGVSGHLVPVRDAEALAARMAEMANDLKTVARMGAAGRILAEERFDVHAVNRVIMGALRLA